MAEKSHGIYRNFQEVEKMADAESEDEDFAVDSQEMEEANNSSSDSEDEDQEAAVDVEEEDFTVQVKGGEIQKMKFDNMHQVFVGYRQSKRVHHCSRIHRHVADKPRTSMST